MNLVLFDRFISTNGHHCHLEQLENLITFRFIVRKIVFGQQDGLQVTTKLSPIFLQQGILPAEIVIQEIHVYPDKI